MPLIHVSDGPIDANDGRLFDNPPRVGNRTYGQRLLLTGTERVIDVDDGDLSWTGFQTVTVSTTALALTADAADGADQAFITTEVATVRFRLDSVAPTATAGHVLESGSTLFLKGRAEIDGFRTIRRDGADATLQVSYGRRVL